MKENEINNLRRNYKDSVFCFLFGSEDKALELYNAVFGTDYGPETPVSMNTIDEAIFMARKNDISFTIDNRFVVMVEHQSTVNLNMCVRFLQYWVYLLRKYEAEKQLDFYRRELQKIPEPEFIVFYNGLEDLPEITELKLSDSYLTVDENSSGNTKKHDAELICRVYNINKGKNSEIVSRSQNLAGYCELISRIRDAQTDGRLTRERLHQILSDCRNEGILPEFLREYGSEVDEMLFRVFSEEEVIEYARQDGYDLGVKDGIKEGEELGIRKGLKEGAIQTARALKNKLIPCETIAECTGLTIEEVEAL